MKTEPGLHVLKSSLLATAHGFSTRHGGVSEAPYHSLNLGGSDDEPARIAQNRALFLQSLGIGDAAVAWMRQVHGAEVGVAQAGPQTCDALVTNEKNIVLAVSTADCYPLLLHDPVNNVIGAAHAGWRGTLARIGAATVKAMCALGASPQHICAAIGPGICGEKYEVSEDVIAQFRQAGFPHSIHQNRMLDLARANSFVLEECGINGNHIDTLHRCSTEDDFFSFRRDNGKTGRMWSVIML
ncbi:MAG: peptidoglycan editing factor PgeF [Bacteroidetes bacterium]|nr:peptidoglycan editing factor PgeF [Bacteroidota bacterium]